ncbi:putative nuclease HARBI1 isoform X2 [Heterodontus francisci]
MGLIHPIFLQPRELEERMRQRRALAAQQLRPQRQQQVAPMRGAAQNEAAQGSRRRRWTLTRQRVYRTRTNYLHMSETECLSRLRLSRETVTELCGIVQQDLLPQGFGGHPMPVALKVTAALNFFASGGFQGSTGNLCGISQPATHRCIREVTDALFHRANDFIHFSTDEDSQTARSLAFGDIAQFPKVQGVIDCTHVAIRAPCDQPAAFVNRKAFHSLKVQLVCDHRQRILQVCARFPGSCHDAYILLNSRLPEIFEAPAEVDGWILGDKGYPLQTWLMTPVRHPQSAAEKRYNEAHASTRAIIKHTIGLLKMRFRCLDRSGGALQYAPQRVSRIIVVCCALHNLAMQRGHLLQQDEWEEQHSSDEDELDEPEEEAMNVNDPLPDSRAMERSARHTRDNLIYTGFAQE